MERLCDIRRAELDDDLLASGGGVAGVLETQVGVEAVGGACFEDLGEDEGGECGRLEEEADEGTVDDGFGYERRFGELLGLQLA